MKAKKKMKKIVITSTNVYQSEHDYGKVVADYVKYIRDRSDKRIGRVTIKIKIETTDEIGDSGFTSVYMH